MKEINQLEGTVSRGDRANQFGAFDALKGFREALLMKEFEHEMTLQGEKNEEQIKRLTQALLSYEKGEKVRVEYFENGHIKTFVGTIKIDFVFKNIMFESKILSFEEI